MDLQRKGQVLFEFFWSFKQDFYVNHFQLLEMYRGHVNSTLFKCISVDRVDSFEQQLHCIILKVLSHLVKPNVNISYAPTVPLFL